MAAPSPVTPWLRREAFLVSMLATAAAAAALAEPLHAPWLRIAGAVIALAGAGARALITLRRSGLERRLETVDVDRHLASAAMRTISPTDIGVDPAAQDLLPGRTIPEYVTRDVDVEVDEALTAGLDGTGPWVILVVGTSKVGKSRALYEALRRHDERESLELAHPVDKAGLESHIDSLATDRRRDRARVLWLDDIEPYLNQGVTLARLRAWRQHAGPRSIVVGTYGGKGSESASEADSRTLVTLANELLGAAAEITMRATTDRELDPIRERLAAGTLDDIRHHGLAAYLVAAPALQRKLATQLHGAGEAPCPEGVAVVSAAVDWARAGRTDPIPRAQLLQLWKTYLPPHVPPSEEAFERGVDWSMRPVAGTIGLLDPNVAYQAYDLVVALVERRSDSPPDAAWAAAVDGVSDVGAIAVGSSAFDYGRYRDAVAAFRKAQDSPSPRLAAGAGYNAGRALGRLDEWDEEVAAYRDVLSRFGESREEPLRLIVARSMVNLGVALTDLEQFDEALDVLADVVTRFGEEPEVGYREQIAMAIANRARTLAVVRRDAELELACLEVIRRFGSLDRPVFNEAVARALRFRWLYAPRPVAVEGELRSVSTMLRAAQAFLARSPRDVWHIYVGMVVVNISAVLFSRRELSGSLSALEGIGDRFRLDTTVEGRFLVAVSHVDRAIVLRSDGAQAAALAELEELEVAADAPLTPIVGRGMLLKALTLQALGRHEDCAIAMRTVDTLPWDAAVAAAEEDGDAAQAAFCRAIAGAPATDDDPVARLGAIEQAVRDELTLPTWFEWPVH